MKNLLEYILIHLVQYPDDVVVEEVDQSEETLYTLRVNPEDVGRVIGKGGNLIQAIRSIARVRAIKEDRRIRIEIADGRTE